MALFVLVAAPTLAFAARSGGSFGGRGGFRSGGSSFSGSRSASRGYSPRGYGGPNVIVMPGFGWGFGGMGMGMGGGFGFMGTLMMVGVLGLGAVMVMRALRGTRAAGGRGWSAEDEDDEPSIAPSRAFVYKVQLGLGRSARAIQGRLEKFSAEGDTSTEAGLAHLLQQTALELMREKESIRYAGLEASGPMSFTNGETKMNALSLTERSRFQVERVRGAEGKVRRSEAAAVEAKDALEYLLVTLVVATRAPLSPLTKLTEREHLDAVLGALGGVAPNALLGLEVIWTPADPADALTETDLMTTYPELRSL